MIDRQINYIPQIVKKSNILIEKHNYLTAVNQRIFNFVISYAQKYNITTNNLEIPVRQVTNLIGKKEVYKTKEFFSNIGENLVSNILNLIEPTENECDITNLIGRFKLKDGIIHIKLTDEFLSLIHVEKDYTKIDLNITKSFKSKHSSVLYEYYLMKLKYNTHYSKNKMFTTQKTEIETLRKLLCKNSKSYRNIDLFKRKILKPALEEINQKTDLEITYKDLKCEFNNKTINGFEFTINQNEIKQIQVSDDMHALKTKLNTAVIEPVKAIIKSTVEKAKEIPSKIAKYNFSPNQQELFTELRGYGVAEKLAIEAVKTSIELVNMINYEILTTKPNILTEGNYGGLFKVKWDNKASYERKLEAKKVKFQAEAEKAKEVKLQAKKEQEQKEISNQKSQEKIYKYTKIYNALNDKEKKELLTFCRRDSFFKLHHYIENDKFINLDNFAISHKMVVITYLEKRENATNIVPENSAVKNKIKEQNNNTSSLNDLINGLMFNFSM